jgi:hypothetical protein
MVLWRKKEEKVMKEANNKIVGPLTLLNKELNKDILNKLEYLNEKCVNGNDQTMLIQNICEPQKEIMLKNNEISLSNFPESLTRNIWELMVLWRKEEEKVMKEANNKIIGRLTLLNKEINKDIQNKLEYLSEKCTNGNDQTSLIQTICEPQKEIMLKINEILNKIT